MSSVVDLGRATLAAVQAFRRHRTEAESALQGLIDQIRALEVERDQLNLSPAACADLIDAAHAHIAGLAGEGRQRIARTVTAHLKPRFQASQCGSVLTAREVTWEHVRAATDGGNLGRVGNAMATFADAPNGYFDQPKFDAIGLIAVLEVPIKTLVAVMISESWPDAYQNALPGAQREARIAQIDVEMESLVVRRDELASLVAQAIKG